MSLIASSLPGRLRLRAPALRDAARLESLRVVVARWRHVLAVETNPKAGSLLIHYDAEKLARPGIEARAVATVEKVLGADAQRTAKVGADEPTALPGCRAKDALMKPLCGRAVKQTTLSSPLRILAVADDKTVAHVHPHGGTPRVRVNRWAKRGMLASLAVSLLLAAAGTKRWHALTGVLFLHGLAAHLWVHRRHILR